MRHSIIQKVGLSLSRFSHPRYRMNEQRFYKEKLENPIVLRTDILRKISSQHFKEIRNLSKDEIFGLCEKLLKSGNGEERAIAFDWAYKCKKRYEKKDFRMFERWLKKYVHGWGSCDHLCVHPLGHFIEKFPVFSAKTKKWARSKNKWLRRASAVALIPALRRKLLLKEAFQTADILLKDDDDLVQKGYGWMLKEASNRFPKEVFRYVMKNRKRMPRTALRYAIEKMPAKLKKASMKKDF